MNRFATGMLSVLGAVIATIVHGVTVALLDAGFSQVFPLLSLYRENDLMMACVVTLLVIYALSAIVTNLFVGFFDRKVPRANTEAICWWLMLRIAFSALSAFNDVGLTGYEQAFYYAIGAALAVFIPSYVILWRNRPKSNS